MSVLLLTFFHLIAGIQGQTQRDRTFQRMLAGNWKYTSGSYEYYDASNRKLGERNMDGVGNMDIQVGKKEVKVIYPNRGVFISPYNVASENGRYSVTIRFSERAAKYDVSYISNSSLKLHIRQNITMLIDNDPEKKVSYCILTFNLNKVF